MYVMYDSRFLISTVNRGKTVPIFNVLQLHFDTTSLAMSLSCCMMSKVVKIQDAFNVRFILLWKHDSSFNTINDRIKLSYSIASTICIMIYFSECRKFGCLTSCMQIPFVLVSICHTSFVLDLIFKVYWLLEQSLIFFDMQISQ